jgi:nucleoid-associated protein YgaU
MVEKATITPRNGQAIPVLFNPSSYTLEDSNHLAEIGIPGLGAPIVQYVRGNTRAMSMDLLFDTYEQQEDVSRRTDAVYGLLEIDPTTHAPPICTFAWGPLSFTCVLERVSGRFTLFLPDGTPVRATLGVTLKEHVPVDLEVRERPLESSDHTTTRVVRRHDTLASIAAEEYGRPGAWRAIAEANGIDDPLRLRRGTTLTIPRSPGRT